MYYFYENFNFLPITTLFLLQIRHANSQLKQERLTVVFGGGARKGGGGTLAISLHGQMTQYSKIRQREYSYDTT
jgi:hypothetical protein